MTDFKLKINELREKKDFKILAHYYEESDIQDIADYVGDSLFLAQKGSELETNLVLLAGVTFMGESVKILSPDKTVLVPDMNAGCSLVDHSPYNKYLEWRRKYPEAICVTYVNSSAAVKTITDVACTSSNVEKVINSIPKDRQILFGPDINLGRYLEKKFKRDMILWPGSCQVHVQFSAQKLFELKAKHPGSIVIAHPECEENVLLASDVIGSTSALLKSTTDNMNVKTFIVATELGIFHQMKKLRPDATFIQAPVEDENCACNECPYMKMNTMEKIYNALVNETPKIELDDKTIQDANVCLDRMMKITNGESIEWPSRFEL